MYWIKENCSLHLCNISYDLIFYYINLWSNILLYKQTEGKTMEEPFYSYNSLSLKIRKYGKVWASQNCWRTLVEFLKISTPLISSVITRSIHMSLTNSRKEVIFLRYLTTFTDFTKVVGPTDMTDKFWSGPTIVYLKSGRLSGMFCGVPPVN